MLRIEDLKIGDKLAPANYEQFCAALFNIEGVEDISSNALYTIFMYNNVFKHFSKDEIEERYKILLTYNNLFVISDIDPSDPDYNYIISAYDINCKTTNEIKVVPLLTLIMRQNYLNLSTSNVESTNNHTCTKGSTPLLGHWIRKNCGKNMEEV